MVTMQADFTDRPEDLPELIKRFEGGADIVVSERQPNAAWPKPARLLRRIAPIVTKPFVDVPGIADPYGTLRAYRISVIRDLVKDSSDTSLLRTDGWAANVELLVRAAKYSRRIETVSGSPRYELRPRETRVRTWKGAIALFKSARALRGAIQPT
jgi:hypothetical protein